MNLDDKKRRREEMKELYAFEQKIIAKTGNNERVFKKYGLLNNKWIEKYKNNYNYEFYLQNGQINYNSSENIFIIEDLSPTLKYKNEMKIPNDFALVSKKFIDLISENFNDEYERKRLLNLCYEALMIQNYLIITYKEKNLILYYLFFKDYQIFKMQYILKYSNQININEEIDLILKEDFYNYLKKRNISIYNSKQEIILNGQKIGCFYSLIFENLNKNKIISSDTDENKNNILNNNLVSNEYLNSIFLCFYQIKELNQGIPVNNNDIKDINQNEAIIVVNDFFKNFKTQKKKSFNKIQNIFKTKIPYTYNKTLFSIFKRLNPEKAQDKKNTLDNNSNQAIQFDEKEQKLIFLRDHETNSIFQKLFFCIQVKKIYCPKCTLYRYEFKYHRYLYITSKIITKIQDNISKVVNNTENLKCNFCGLTNHCTSSRHITDFSKILIITLGGDNINDFNLKENLNIDNGNTRYELICFIDQKNDVYFKKNNVWNTYDKNYDEQIIKMKDNMNPVVLFYELEKNNIDNHSSSNNNINLNTNKDNNINKNNPNIINNNYNNISGNPNCQNIMATKGSNIYPNNINQNNMNIFNNMNLMNNNLNNNIQGFNTQNINNINNNFSNLNNFNSQQNFGNNFNMKNSNNIIINNKNNINNNQNHQRSQSFYNNKNKYMNNIFNGGNNNLNFNMNNNMNFKMMSSNMINNINSNNYNNLNNNMKNNINNNMNNQFNINNYVNINNNGNMNGNAINNILNNNHNNNMMCRSMDFKMMKNNNNNGFNNNMINNNMVNMANNNINYNWNNNNNNHMINNITNNIHVINNMNGGNIINANNNSNNPGNNINNNKNNESGHNNHNKQITNKSNNNNQNHQSKNLINKNNNNNNLIFLTFTFKKYNKQIFIDVLDNILFSQVIKELQDKYAWLKKIKKKLYYFEGIELNGNKNIKEYGIKDNSDITVII